MEAPVGGRPHATESGPQQPSPQQAALIARVIYLALIGGVCTFAVVAVAATEWGAAGTRAADAPPVFSYVWAALAIGSFPLVLLFRGKARKAAGLDDSRMGRERAIDPVQVQTNLFVSWALVEGPALFGVVIFFLFARLDILAYALAIAAVGWALTFPSREYFEAERGRRLR